MGDDTKNRELIHRLILKQSFQDRIVVIRSDFSIPLNGFKDVEQKRMWVQRIEGGNRPYIFDNDSTLELKAKFLKRVATLLSEFKMPPTLLSVVSNYILDGKKPSAKSSGQFACVVEHPIFKDTDLSIEQYWDKQKFKYVKLLIHEDAKKSDVIKYIKNHWTEIEQTISKVKKPKPRIRKRTMAEVHSLIHTIDNEIRTGKRTRDKAFRYPSQQIASIMFDEFAISIDFDNVRKIISTEKRRRK